MQPTLSLVLTLACASPLLAVPQTIADDMGLSDLSERLGGAVPTGLGVVVAQVEAPVGQAYAPDPLHAEFMGKSFTLESPGNGASGHATTVGRHFYGTTGIAPGPTDIRCYSVNHWTGIGFLGGTGTGVPPLDPGPMRIFNHSWIGSLPSSNTYLRKVDSLIESKDVVMTVGVNNGSQTLTTLMLAQAFNTISVGRSDGSHASGTTTSQVDGPGRMKPELVAPGTATSWATGLVGGAAAVLIETAETHAGLAANPAAARAMLLRAILMAGAEKRAGWQNGAPASGSQRGSTSTPLDSVFGADEVDINQSHWILTSLEQEGKATHVGAEVSQRGWDVFTINEADSRFWRFEVAVEKPVVDVTLSWNRTVAPTFNGWFLANLDLRLWSVDGNDSLVTLVGEASAAVYSGGNVESVSAVDNVELLHLTDLVPGEYALEVTRLVDFSFLAADASVAWNMLPPENDVYCTAKVASAGCLPRITSLGYPSATDPNTFSIGAEDVLNNKNGLLFYGYAPAALPFLDGTLCVQPPLKRTGVQPAGGNPPPDDCSGAFQFDMRGQIQGGQDPFLLPGVDVYAQYWFRDPAAASGSGLSDALHFAVGQ